MQHEFVQVGSWSRCAILESRRLSSPDGRGQGEGRWRLLFQNLKSEIDRSLLTSTATRFTESLHSFPPRIGATNGGARLRRALISPSDRKLGLDGVSPHRVHGKREKRPQCFSGRTLFWSVTCRNARPGRAPVCLPLSTTTCPLTMTYSTPSLYWNGSA